MTLTQATRMLDQWLVWSGLGYWKDRGKASSYAPQLAYGLFDTTIAELSANAGIRTVYQSRLVYPGANEREFKSREGKVGAFRCLLRHAGGVLCAHEVNGWRA